MDNQYLLSAVENSQEISTALSSSQQSEKTRDTAIVVHVFFSQDKKHCDLQEFLLLADSANVDVLDTITTSRTTPQAKYFVGEGKGSRNCRCGAIT